MIRRIVLALFLGTVVAAVAAGAGRSAEAQKAAGKPAATPKSKSPAVVPYVDTKMEYAEGLDLVQDPATSQVLERIAKSNLYDVRDGYVRSIVARSKGLRLVKEDAENYYVAATARASLTPRPPEKSKEDPPELLLAVAAEADELVLPLSKKSIRLEEASEGLPAVGMWRQNFVLADLDGDRLPEIVAPPPRLSAVPIQVFRRVGAGWRGLDVTFADPETVGMGYGGVDVADMDGDGRPDILFIQHGGGPAIAWNQGGLEFRVERRGLPVHLHGQSIVAADVDADGKRDVLVMSDDSEFVKAQEAERLSGRAVLDAPLPGGYVPGIDTRAYFNRGGVYREVSQGLEKSCFGEALAVQDKPVDGGPAFLVTSCAYYGNNHVIRSWRSEGGGWELSGRKSTELFGLHSGVAMGSYRGKPAAFVTYVKNGPERFRKLQGDGLSIYYRDGGEWKLKRLCKHVVSPPTESPAIAVADLDGDGLDDVAWADNRAHKLRVAFQRADGEFEEMVPAGLPAFVNRGVCLRAADVDGDGRKDLVLMYTYQTTDPTRSGGFRVFRNVR